MARFLTGGLLTLYEQLGALVSAHGLSAFYADPRLEVFVPAEGQVVVLGALRYPIRLERADWDARVRVADSGDDLAAAFVHAALSGAGEVIAEARRAAEEDPAPLVARVPELIEQRSPGEVEFDLLEDSDFELTERYDPEGNPEETWVSCQVLRWRTDFVAPGTVRPPDLDFEDALTWRVSQWEWIDEGDEETDGEWALRANVPIAVIDVLDHLPAPLRPWVGRVTADAIELLEHIATEEPEFASAADRLKAELQDVA
jgi:hypothetical protein